jgi:hypothetical protein
MSETFRLSRNRALWRFSHRGLLFCYTGDDANYGDSLELRREFTCARVITVRVYPTFTVAADEVYLLYVSHQLPLLCGVSRQSRLRAGFAGPKGGRAGARASRAIPASPAGGRSWGPARSGSSSPRRAAWREAPQNQGSVRATAPPLRARHPRRELRPSARPWPVFGTAHQPRDHRIERDVTGRRQQMRLVHHHRPKRPWNRWPVHRKRALMAPV